MMDSRALRLASMRTWLWRASICLETCPATASWSGHRIAHHVIGEDPGGRAEVIALIAPLGTGLKCVEPAASCGAPKRLVLQAGGHRQAHRIEGQADRLAGTRDGEFQGEI